MNHMLKINKQNVINNIDTCRNGKDVCLMVKANTYGLGIEPVKMLIELGYTMFGVSTLEEALKLRALNSDITILIVSYIELSDIQLCIDNDLTFTLYDRSMLNQLTGDAKFHLKVDTNMGRLGFQLDELADVAEYLTTHNLQPQGIFSHLACASETDKTEIAITNFEYALKVFKEFDFKYIHLLNTYGSLNYDTKFDNLVRIGIGIWGYLANAHEANLSRKALKPALSLELTISHVKKYSGFVSYDHLDQVEGTVLTVPLGYHDGFARSLRGYKIPDVGTVVGNVNMCQHMVLANGDKVYNRGDYYQLFTGNQLYDICNYGQFTTYEFLVSLSDRIKRVIV